MMIDDGMTMVIPFDHENSHINTGRHFQRGGEFRPSKPLEQKRSIYARISGILVSPAE